MSPFVLFPVKFGARTTIQQCKLSAAIGPLYNGILWREQILSEDIDSRDEQPHFTSDVNGIDWYRQENGVGKKTGA